MEESFLVALREVESKNVIIDGKDRQEMIRERVQGRLEAFREQKQRLVSPEEDAMVRRRLGSVVEYFGLPMRFIFLQ